MTDVTIPAAEGEMPAYLATPSGPRRRPGVVVLHDAIGMTQDLRNQADWIAGEGFVATAPDLFHWGGKTACLRAVVRDLQAGHGRTFHEVEATRAWLADHDACTGTIGVLGCSMGGGLALLLASGHGFTAASVNYGMAPKDIDLDTLLAEACPIVASYGRKDPTLKGAARRLEQSLAAVGVDHDVKEYPDAAHGFLNDHKAAHDKVPFLFATMFKVMGTKYEGSSAGDARARTISFFHTYLQ